MSKGVKRACGGRVPKAVCADCGKGGRSAQPVCLWVCGGRSVADYGEARVEVVLCEDCCGAYLVCEQCSDLMDYGVHVRGPGVLCPQCGGQADA